MFRLTKIAAVTAFISLIIAGCGKNPLASKEVAPVKFRDVPAQRLNYRFEPDVPGPDAKLTPAMIQKRDAKVQADFDANRSQEILDRTIASPDKKRVAAVYRQVSDDTAEFRLDIYSPDGKLVKKVTHEEMAVHFPDTIVWSPDSQNIAFVAMVRSVEGMVPAVPDPLKGKGPEELKKEEAEANTSEANASEDSNAAVPVEDDSSKEAAKDVITFRTEQIYLCSSEGTDLKPLTKNEGLMYFYFVWSPDSSAIASLATSITEWRVRQARMTGAGEVFVPEGRPRLVEKNGRERLLDDYATTVRPVWSPDSAKVAVAFDKQLRIYDASGERPTQAAIPLNNDLLLASKAWEEKKKKEEGPGSLAVPDANTNAVEKPKEPELPANANVQKSTTTLPSAESLVSFNPIVLLEWPEDSMIYLQTAYVKNFLDSAESVTSFARWHRLILSPQPVALKKEGE
jgi:hypothetical protein